MQSKQRFKLKQKEAAAPHTFFLRSWRHPHYDKIYRACGAIPIIREGDERNECPSSSARKEVSEISALPKPFPVKQLSPKTPTMNTPIVLKGLAVGSVRTKETSAIPQKSRPLRYQKKNSPLTPPSTPEPGHRIDSTPSRIVHPSTFTPHSKRISVLESKRHISTNNTKEASYESQEAQGSLKPSKSVRVVTPEDVVHAYLTILRERDPRHCLINLVDEEKRLMNLSPDRFGELLKKACVKAKRPDVVIGDDSWADWEEGRCCQ